MAVAVSVLKTRVARTELTLLVDIGMNSTSADLMDSYDSSCTSCGVKEDHSAYWTPALYFQYSNGTNVMVDQVGGMLA